MGKQGFTLVEILIVIAISAMLATFSIIYTRIGQNQIALSVEESKVAQLILEAKELSIATYGAHTTTCAYGVQFNYQSSTYSLFAYNAATSSADYPGRTICPSIASTSAAFDAGAVGEYEAGSWQVHTAQGVVLESSTDPSASDTIQDVLFYPPDPCTMIGFVGQGTLQQNCVAPGGAPATGYVYLQTVDGSAARAVSVSSGGQVGL